MNNDKLTTMESELSALAAQVKVCRALFEGAYCPTQALDVAEGLGYYSREQWRAIIGGLVARGVVYCYYDAFCEERLGVAKDWYNMLMEEAVQ